MQAKLMSKLTQLDDGQLLVKMLASLQETLVFVQGLSNRAEDDQLNGSGIGAQVSSTLALAFYKQAISAKGTDAQKMLTAQITELIELKNTNQDMRVQLKKESGLNSQSFGNDGDKTEAECGRCCETRASCADQIKESHVKMKESEIIIQEVAKEIKDKKEKLELHAAKLVQMLFLLDGRVDEKEAVTDELESLSDVSEFCSLDSLDE